MTFKERALEELAAKRGRAATKFCFAGFDGFVDTIVKPVATRHGPGEAFDAIPSITEFANRIAGAAGKSTNIEFYPEMEKLGGNGPIMANALISAGFKVKYLGALGTPHLHHAFEEFARRSEAVSVAEPGLTTAVEFGDGKLMFGITRSLETLTYASLVKPLGEGLFLDLVSRADLVAMVNWTMIPGMTEIFNGFLDQALLMLPPRENRIFFFDLADPEKRSRGDLLAALRTITRFQSHGLATLGLNLKEAQQVHDVLGHSPLGTSPDDLKTLATQIRQSLNIGCVVVHPRESAACATRDDAWWIPGPYCEKPVITTGAGDHFNAGFTAGQLLGLSPEACLATGVSFSGHYVRTAQSPSLAAVDAFLRSWK